MTTRTRASETVALQWTWTSEEEFRHTQVLDLEGKPPGQNSLILSPREKIKGDPKIFQICLAIYRIFLFF